MTFDVVDGVVRSPMVSVRVGSEMTKLIVDSGATHHVLTVEFADRAGLKYEPGEAGTDLTGSLVPSWNVGEVLVEVADTEVGLRDVVAISGPIPFEGWGIGGFLSPQRLWPSAVVVLDLAIDNLMVVEGETDAILAWLQRRYPKFALLDASRHSGGTVGVIAAVVPCDPRVALLDTGSGATEFAMAAVPGLLGPSVESGRGVSGTRIECQEVSGRVLEVGEARFTLQVLYVRDHMPPPEGFTGMEAPQGLIGMDVMKGTVLVVGREDDGLVRWLVPHAR